MVQYRKWGRTGLKVSEVSLGTMAFGRWIDEKLSNRVLDAALDSGINVLDTADIYGKGMDNDNPNMSGESESIIGRALKGRRDKVVLATKANGRVGTGINDVGSSRYHIFQALESSLSRLQTDYIDIYYMHWFDSETPLEETLGALNDLVKQGKIRYIACSNFAAWQLAKARGISALHGLSYFEGIQPDYSLINRQIERELVPYAISDHIGIMSYSPLGRGILTGKYKQGEQPPTDSRLAAGERRLKSILHGNPSFALVDAIRPIAERRGLTLAQFSLVWVLSHSYISSAILGISKPEQIQDLLQYANERLTPEELTEVNEATRQVGIYFNESL